MGWSLMEVVSYHLGTSLHRSGGGVFDLTRFVLDQNGSLSQRQVVPAV